MSDALDRVAKLPPSAYTYEVRPVASPSVGADFAITCNDGGVWRVRSIVAQLHASAVAGNRFPQLVVDDSTTTSMKYPAGVATAANGTTVYSWNLGYPVMEAAIEGALVVVPITDFVLHQGWRVHPVTVNLDAGDQWSAISITIERILTPPHTITQGFVDAAMHEADVESALSAGGYLS